MSEPVKRFHQHRENLKLNFVFRKGAKKILQDNTIQHEENVKHRNA
jgi:hypothetical protein